MAIVFGTDGWRGIIADDFTYASVALVAQAAAEYFTEEPNANKGVVIGYDARFMSDRFARTVARVFAANGLLVHLTDGISSTPQVSLAATKKSLAGGVIITASHNPAIYNGFKLKACFGGPATPEDVQKVQDRVTALEAAGVPAPTLPDYDELVRTGKIILFDAKREYIDYVKSKIDLNVIAKAGFRVLYDPMYGSGIHTLEHLLPNVDQIHNSFNPSFGKLDHPEPLGEYLGVLMNGVKAGGYSVGMATDGDADRLGMVDEDGMFVDSHRIFMLLMQYLFEDRRLKGAVAKTISLTTMIDAYCQQNNIRMFETGVGFKFIAKLMTTENIVIGGEESGGLGTSLHIPERDGIFNGLLVLEMMARRGKTLGELSRGLDEEFGMHRYRRVDKTMSVDQKNRILAAARAGVAKLGEYDVISTSTLDGYKFFVEKGWLLIRASGTEPLLRYYAEADTVAKVEALLQAGLTLGS